ncbi:hypothetical protein E4T56_gene6610, partial [Termitomyces sp. T112]
MQPQRLIKCVGEELERVIQPFRFGRGAITDQGGQDHAIARIDKGVDVLAKIGRARRAGAAAVDEHHGRARTRFLHMNVIATGDPVDLLFQATHQIGGAVVGIIGNMGAARVQIEP